MKGLSSTPSSAHALVSVSLNFSRFTTSCKGTGDCAAAKTTLLGATRSTMLSLISPTGSATRVMLSLSKVALPANFAFTSSGS